MAIEVAEGISGSLQETALSDFLHILAWNERSGVLLIWNGTTQVGLFLDQGRIVQAQMSESLDEAIETALLMTGKVPAQELEQARAAFRTGSDRGWHSLRWLTVQGKLDEHDLAVAQEAAIRETLRRVLPWDQGDMQFKPNVPPVRREGLVTLNVEEMLIDSLREIDEQILTTLSPRTLVRWAPNPPHGLTRAMVGIDRFQVLSLCGGQLMVAEIAQRLKREVGTVAEQVQWLLDHGAIVIVPTAPGGAAEASHERVAVEDQLVMMLSRFETTWPVKGINRTKVANALIKMVNIATQTILGYWREVLQPTAAEAVLRVLVLPDLASAVTTSGAHSLGIKADPTILRDGQLIPSALVNAIQVTAERDPEQSLEVLVRLIEQLLLNLVAEVDRPVALVDSFESVNVFMTEMDQRLATLE